MIIIKLNNYVVDLFKYTHAYFVAGNVRYELRKVRTTQDSTYHLMFGMVLWLSPGSESKVPDEASDIDDIPANIPPTQAVVRSQTPQSMNSQQPI